MTKAATIIKLDPDLGRRFKTCCDHHDLYMRHVAADMIEQWLRSLPSILEAPTGTIKTRVTTTVVRSKRGS